MESQARTAHAVSSCYHEPVNRSARLVNYVLRSVALVTTFIAAIVAGTAKGTQPIATAGAAGVHLKIQAAGLSQFDYFVAANAIVCFYLAVSLVLWVLAKGGTKSLIFVLSTVDMISVVLLFSALGSASAMAILFREGAADFDTQICDAFESFCAQISAGIAMTFFAGVVCLLLNFLAHLNLYYTSL